MNKILSGIGQGLADSPVIRKLDSVSSSDSIDGGMSFILAGSSAQATAAAPGVFAKIRGLFNTSLSEAFGMPGKYRWKAAVTSGKSASTFYWPMGDAQQQPPGIMKTIPDSEARVLFDVLPSYLARLEKSTATLLPVFLALFRVSPIKGKAGSESDPLVVTESPPSSKGSGTWVVVLRNVFATSKAQPSAVFDLKGSTVHRSGKRRARAKTLPSGAASVLKDNDWVEEGFRLGISKEASDLLMASLRTDVEWLVRNSLMDYSLMVGFSGSGSTQPGSDHLGIFANGVASTNPLGPFVYIGFVDVLGRWNLKRVGARAFKTMLRLPFRDSSGLSTVPPSKYGPRFLEFMEKSVL